MKGPKTQEILKTIFIELGNVTQAWHQAALQQNIEWLDLGSVALNQQRYAKAKQLLASAHQLYIEIDEPYGVARTTGHLGSLHPGNVG